MSAQRRRLEILIFLQRCSVFVTRKVTPATRSFNEKTAHNRATTCRGSYVNHYNESITEIITRRRFLQQAGLLSGSLGLGILASLGSPQTALAICEPPGSPAPLKNGAVIVDQSGSVGPHLH